MASKFEDILSAAKTVAAGLGLTGIAGTNIAIQKVPRVRDMADPASPGLILARFGRRRPFNNEGSNASDVYGYPVIMAAYQASNQDQAADRDRASQWVDTLIGAFARKRLTGVTSIFDTLVEPQEEFQRAAFESGYDFVGAVFLFKSWELRS